MRFFLRRRRRILLLCSFCFRSILHSLESDLLCTVCSCSSSSLFGLLIVLIDHSITITKCKVHWNRRAEYNSFLLWSRSLERIISDDDRYSVESKPFDKHRFQQNEASKKKKLKRCASLNQQTREIKHRHHQQKEWARWEMN